MSRTRCDVSIARSLAIQRNGARTKLLAGNVVKRVMTVATVRRRLFPVLIARAITLPRQSPALYGSVKKRFSALRRKSLCRIMKLGSLSRPRRLPLHRPLPLTLALPDRPQKQFRWIAKLLRSGLGHSRLFVKLLDFPPFRQHRRVRVHQIKRQHMNRVVTKTSTHVKVRRQNHHPYHETIRI